MSDVEDRLSALDPAGQQPYQHQNLESMIARVTRHRVTSKSHAWRTFQLKVASALVTSALLTTGAIATFSNGPGLAVLSIQRTSNIPSPQSSAFASASATATATANFEEFKFNAGAGLSAVAPAAPSFALQVPSKAPHEASRVASVFGVSGTPVNTNGDGSNWKVTDAAGDSLSYQDTGVPQWSFVSTSSGALQSSRAASLSVLPGHSSVNALAQSYLLKLGYDYSLSTPTFGTSTSGILNADGSMKAAVSDSVVTYGVLVDGLATDQSLSFSVDSSDVVVAASGPAFTLGASKNYPLEGPLAGISALNTVQKSRFASTSTTPVSATNGATNTPSSPPIIDVTLSSYSLSFESYQLSDGSMWLLPVYIYTGHLSNKVAASPKSRWRQLAIDPRYVKVSMASSHGVSNSPAN